ncbi:MAG: radical SAM family heme chaperone HemW [Bacteroidales bacterium]|nr:radical SAM family heme chaperone HemW [Bacteroidales bacterium]
MIYVHVPFCKSFCIYCGFYSENLSRCGGERAAEEWSRLVREEASLREEEILSSAEVDTLYIGGGTPSVLPLSVIEDTVSFLKAILGKKDGDSFEEFTIEVNPDDIVKNGKAYLDGLCRIGVNRISMGVQSFDDSILHWMGRRHSSDDVLKAVGMIRDAGFRNLSIDLISGISGLSDDVWEETLSKAVSLSPEHISAYQLSVEEGSALDDLVSRGGYLEADETQCERQYGILCRYLSQAGYDHYEVSNFCKQGFRAVHNSAYWKRVPYVGLGPGAHSLDGERLRKWNSESFPEYSSSSEILSEEDLRVETIMLSLRTSDGMPFEKLLSLSEEGKVRSLMDEGVLVKDGGRFRIPEKCFFTSDSIIRDLL